MKFVLYTNSVSAHQLPLAREIVKLVGAENFRYVYTGTTLQGGAQEVAASEPWIIKEEGSWLEDCDALLVGGIRPIDLMERRLAAGKATFYMSERWFKPILFYFGHIEVRFPGWLRLLHPRYFKMARRFARLFDYPAYRFLPIGPHSARDMRLLQRILSPCHRLTPINYIPWGYFVSPSAQTSTPSPQSSTQSLPLRVLWAGRMIKLKHVETIIRAVAKVKDASLTIVGDGPERAYLAFRAQGLPNVFFKPPVSLEKVREEMRAHDVLVFASNGYDGWGAVVSEALLEGMCVIGTYEAGASAALLPPDHLFHCGDVHGLANCLKRFCELSPNTIGEWTAEIGARRVVSAFNGMRDSSMTGGAACVG